MVEAFDRLLRQALLVTAIAGFLAGWSSISRRRRPGARRKFARRRCGRSWPTFFRSQLRIEVLSYAELPPELSMRPAGVLPQNEGPTDARANRKSGLQPQGV